MPLTINYLVDFPVGFAEAIQTQLNKEEEYYVEWFDDDSEFPTLMASAASMNEANWEVLEKVNQDDEENTWSKVNKFDVESYVDVAEKDSDDLKPKKREVKPLWKSEEKKEKTSNDDISGDLDSDIIALYFEQKARSKNARRSGHLSKLENLRTVDCHYFKGVYDMGTAKSKEQQDKLAAMDSQHGFFTWRNKNYALRRAAKNIQTKDYWLGFYLHYDVRANVRSKSKNMDMGEFSVFDPLSSRNPTKVPFE